MKLSILENVILVVASVLVPPLGPFAILMICFDLARAWRGW